MESQPKQLGFEFYDQIPVKMVDQTFVKGFTSNYEDFEKLMKMESSHEEALLPLPPLYTKNL